MEPYRIILELIIMRKTLLILILVFVFKSMFSQVYEKMLDTSKQWNILLGYYAPDGNSYSTESYIIMGDTILDGIECKTVGYSNQSSTQYHKSSIFISEDSIGNIHRVVYNSQNQVYEKKIMYDFNLNIGDRIAPYSECGYTFFNDTFEVFAVDTFFFAQKMRKRLTLGFPGTSQLTEYWYEGVGSSMGLIYPGCSKIDFGYDLLCYYEKDTLLYNYNYFGNNSCWITVSNTENNLEAKPLFTPNPVHETIYIEADKDFLECVIYDLYGRKILIAKENIINLQDIEDGVYFICVNNLSGKKYKDILVVKR